MDICCPARPLDLLACLLLMALTGCQVSDPRFAGRGEYIGRAGDSGASVVRLKGAPPLDNVSYWDGDSAVGGPSVKINLREQRAYFYKGGNLVGVSVVSSGREGYGTPSGNFKVVQKDINHASNLYGDYVDAAGNVVKKDVDFRKDPKPPRTTFRGAPMPYFMRIHGGVGLHAGFLPGYAASHGCIRAPEDMAATFFQNVQVGTPVEVIN